MWEKNQSRGKHCLAQVVKRVLYTQAACLLAFFRLLVSLLHSPYRMVRKRATRLAAAHLILRTPNGGR